MCLSLGALLRCQSSPVSQCIWKAHDSASACKALSLHQSSFAALPPVHALGRLLVGLGCSSMAVVGPFQPAWAEIVKQANDEIVVFSHTSQCQGSIEAHISLDSFAEAPCLQALNCLTAAEASDVAQKASQTVETDSNCSPINVPLVYAQALFRISSSTAEQSTPFLDFAGVLSPAKAHSLLSHIHTLEAEAGWRLRVITKSGSSTSLSGKDLKDLWKPDEKTVIVVEDLSSRNILNFSAGADVMVKLPRQFFLELQSRYGNQFYVQQEGEGEALISTVQAIQECLSRLEGCKNVPGLTNDLYYLTLVTSIVGGCVFGFAARLPPSGRVEASWQWVVFLSPLWLLLFVSFGVLPVVGRTSELEPLLKNILGFCAGAVALYLTPIFGPSPISKRQ